MNLRDVFRAQNAAIERAAAARAAEHEGGTWNSVEVVGPVERALFPPICLKCERPASGKLPVSRLFLRNVQSESPTYYVVEEVKAPYCATCIQTHASEQRPIDPDVRRRLMRGWAMRAIPTLIMLGLNLWLIAVVVPTFIESLKPGAELWAKLVFGGVTAFLTLCAWLWYRGFRNSGRSLIQEPKPRDRPSYVQIEVGPLGSRLIVPTEPTSVLRAVNFSDDLSEPLEGERHRFTFERPLVAARFAESNRDKSWDPTSRRARLARTATLVIGVVVIVGGLLGMAFCPPSMSVP